MSLFLWSCDCQLRPCQGEAGGFTLNSVTSRAMYRSRRKMCCSCGVSWTGVNSSQSSFLYFSAREVLCLEGGKDEGVKGLCSFSRILWRNAVVESRSSGYEGMIVWGGYNLSGWGTWLKHKGSAGCSAGCQPWLSGWLLSMDSQETVSLSVPTGDLCLHN